MKCGGDRTQERASTLHQSAVRGNRIIVDWAKRGKSGKKKTRMKNKRICIPKASSNSIRDEAKYRVNGDINEEFLDWLQRTLICTANASMDLDALAYFNQRQFRSSLKSHIPQ